VSKYRFKDNVRLEVGNKRTRLKLTAINANFSLRVHNLLM
jgi:hypothetical protein